MLTRENYDLFLKSAKTDLIGDWVVIGGSLLALLNTQTRLTADIDLCPIDEMNNEARLSLMDISIKSGMPVEAINPSADYFLKQIPDWKKSIEVFLVGSKGRLFRPSLDLYFKLKLNRATDTDISDCLVFYNWYLVEKLEFNKDKIKAILDEYKHKKNVELLIQNIK